MHSKGLWRTDSEEFSAHPEPSRTPAAHARGRPASSSLLCELLDRILAVVPVRPRAWRGSWTPTAAAAPDRQALPARPGGADPPGAPDPSPARACARWRHDGPGPAATPAEPGRPIP